MRDSGSDKPNLEGKPSRTQSAALENGGVSQSEDSEIPRRADAPSYPLSFAQERLWFLDQYEPDSALYILPEARRLIGPLDRDALEKALNRIVARHGILRTNYRAERGDPAQTVSPEAEVELAELDVSPLEEVERKEEVRRVLSKEVQRPFDLTKDLMLRATLVRLEEQEHILLLSLHHIAVDGWSVAILFLELGELYSAYATGGAPQLPELGIRYTDFALWQRERLVGENLDRQVAYWKSRLADSSVLLDLPLDRSRPSVQTFAGASESMNLGVDLSAEVRQFARNSRVTLNTVLMAAFQVLLHHHSGQDDILVGTPVAGRGNPQLEGLVGLFVNTLARRADFSREITFADLLQRSQRDAFEAYDHQELPFERLIDLLHLDRNLSHSPLVQVMLTFHNNPTLVADFHSLEVSRLEVPTGTAKFDLSFSLVDTGQAIVGSAEYATDLFDAPTIRRLIDQYIVLLCAAVRDPDREISELTLLAAAERERVLIEWNETDEDNPFVSLHRQVEQQASHRGDAVALEHDGKQLTYRELERRANRLANELLTHDLGAAPVGVHLERSIESVVATLAVLKTGSAYLPLDRSSPPERLAFMIEDAGVQLLLTDNAAPETISSLPCRTLSLDSFRESGPDQSPLVEVSADDPLYVIYTSGSTGRPKGVVMPQGPLVNLMAWQARRLRDAPGVRVAQMAPLSFDVSCQEIFSTLTSGGTLVVVPESARRDPRELWTFLRNERINRLFLPFVALEQLAEVVEVDPDVSLDTILCAGEQLKITPAIRRLFERLSGCKLINHYGPTETHVVTAFELSGPPSGWPTLPPIGRPIANTQAYVLNRKRRPVPIGVSGELYVGGDCLSSGYLGRPQLTAERFIGNPFNPERSELLYRTGDLARFRPDGELEFLGRNDRQVKIRGFRVELGEVEAILAEHPGVSATAVVSRSEAGLEQLVAYAVPVAESENLVEGLQDLAWQKLPDYMLPSRYVLLEALPLTRSGKIDRQALPEPDTASESLEHSFVAPRTAAERDLAAIWERLLGVQPIGLHHDFFELGGHSLLATRMVAQVENELGVEIPLIELFRTPTIAKLAPRLEPRLGDLESDSSAPGVVTIQSGGSQPPFVMVNPLPIFRPLAQVLSPDQPFLSLVVPPLSGLPRDYRMQDLVEPMLNKLLEELPEPYYIGGWCRYGVIAYELARQLSARGKRVPLLVLFDAYSPTELRSLTPRELRTMGRAIARQELWYHFRSLGQLSATERKVYLAERIGRLLTYLGDRVGGLVSRSRPDAVTSRSFFHEFNLDISSYEPASYEGAVALFKASEAAWKLPTDPTWGWGEHVRTPIEIRRVPGNHLTMFLRPNVEALGSELASTLIGASEEPG